MEFLQLRKYTVPSDPRFPLQFLKYFSLISCVMLYIFAIWTSNGISLTAFKSMLLPYSKFKRWEDGNPLLLKTTFVFPHYLVSMDYSHRGFMYFYEQLCRQGQNFSYAVFLNTCFIMCQDCISYATGVVYLLLCFLVYFCLLDGFV